MKKAFLFATLVLFITSCELDHETQKNNMQTITEDSICFSYYTTDINGKIQNLFNEEDRILVYIGIQNNSQDSIWARVGHFGRCYNRSGQFIEALSLYAPSDTLPEFKAISPKDMKKFGNGYILSVPRDKYLYEKPRVILYKKGREDATKEYVLPLTINFEVR